MGNAAKFLLVVGYAPSRAAQRISGPHDYGIAETVCDRDAFVHSIGDIGRNAGLMDLFHRLLEQFPVLAAVYRVQLRADQFDAVTGKEARLCKLTAHRKPRLTAERSQQTVGLFLENDALEAFLRKGFEIDLVSQRAVGHDRRRIGIAKHDIDAFIFQNAGRPARPHSQIPRLVR